MIEAEKTRLMNRQVNILRNNEKALKESVKNLPPNNQSKEIRSLVKTLRNVRGASLMWQRKTKRLQEELNKLEIKSCKILESWDGCDGVQQNKIHFYSPTMLMELQEQEDEEKLRVANELEIVRLQLAEIEEKGDETTFVGLSFIEEKLAGILSGCRDHLSAENRSLIVLVSAASVLSSVYVLRKMF